MTLTTEKSFRAFRPHAKPGLHAPRASLFSTFGIFIDFKQLRNSSKNRFPNKTVLARFRRAVPFPTGSQNHTFEDKLAPRPSQNLKNYGFRPIPKNTSKIAAWIDAFSRPRATFSIGKQTVSWVLAFYVKVKKNMPGDTPKVMLFRQKVRQRRHLSDLFYLFGLIEKSSIFHRFPIVPPTPTGVDFMWKVGSAGYPKNVQISKNGKKNTDPRWPHLPTYVQGGFRIDFGSHVIDIFMILASILVSFRRLFFNGFSRQLSSRSGIWDGFWNNYKSLADTVFQIICPIRCFLNDLSQTLFQRSHQISRPDKTHKRQKTK